MIPLPPSRSWRGAAYLCAALVMFGLSSWLALAAAVAAPPAQSPQLQGQVLNGTAGAASDSVANLPVTLFQITTAGPVTVTVPTDARGHFTFTGVITAATAYFARLDYAGIRYFSDIQPAPAASAPISLTVYETQPLPADFTLDQVHLILDVQPGRFNGLEFLQLTNPADRAFYMPLPVPAGASDVQFQDVREDTRIRRESDGTLLYPVLPSTTEILYGVILPYAPPDFNLQVPLKTGTAGVNLLVSKTGEVAVAGHGLLPGNPFTSESGQQYLVFSGPSSPAGSTFSATISNLPGRDNTSNVQTLVLVAGGLGALFLLSWPVLSRRSARSPVAGAASRIARLQAIAQLDDDFAAGNLSADDYYTRRAALKAELLPDSTAHD